MKNVATDETVALTHWFGFISWERHVVVLSLLRYVTSCEQPHKTWHLLHKEQTFIEIENREYRLKHGAE